MIHLQPDRLQRREEGKTNETGQGDRLRQIFDQMPPSITFINAVVDQMPEMNVFNLNEDDQNN